MSEYRLAVIGGGNMGAALIGGLLASGWQAPDLAVVEVMEERRAVLGTTFPGVAVSDTVPPPAAAVIAVKPNDAAAAAATASAAGARRILSIAAGVSLDALQKASGADVAVVRAMPNTPALLGKGAAAICAGELAGEDDLHRAES